MHFHIVQHINYNTACQSDTSCEVQLGVIHHCYPNWVIKDGNDTFCRSGDQSPLGHTHTHTHIMSMQEAVHF